MGRWLPRLVFLGLTGPVLVGCGETPAPAPLDTAADTHGQDSTLPDFQPTDFASSDNSSDNLANDGAVDAPVDASAGTCTAVSVNSQGIGKPCSKPEACFGQPAVTCVTDLGPGAPGMCLQYCFGIPNECGANAVCTPRGDQTALCMPYGCAAAYSIVQKSNVDCDLGCKASQVNDFGVGKPCSDHKDCAGKVAQTCPLALKAGNPPWCSMLCSKDTDCGPEALCWRRQVVESGVAFVIGSCTPKSCCTAK